MEAQTPLKIHTNQRLFVQELLSRGINVSKLDDDIELLEAEYNGHHEFILDRFTSIIPHVHTLLSRDKYIAKHLLARNGLMVPEGKIFDKDQIAEALKYAEEIGSPVVLKPNWGSHGDEVHMDINSTEELKSCIDSLLANIEDTMPFFIERQFSGKEYRIFITTQGRYAIVHRDPACIIGDGENTIEALIKIENDKRTTPPRKTCHYSIVIDSIAKTHLKKSGKDLNYIPKKDEKVYLRSSSNVAKGATCEDATDIAHPSVIEIAKKALKAFEGLPYAGIDFLTTDITKEQTRDTYGILEVNPNPGFSLHMKPGKGLPRNVAGFVADLVFPETSKR